MSETTREGAMFFLTYHKISDTAGAGDADFYTVPRARFAWQLEQLQARGAECLTVAELLRAASVPENKFVLSFDDGTLDHYDLVFPLLQARRWQGMFFIPTAKLNQPGYLTNGRVQELAAAGHAIGFHSHEHRRLDLLPEEEIRRQIALSQKIVGDIIGARPLLFVPPGGFVDDRIRKAAVESGVRLMRTMRWGYNKKLDLMALETLPINRHTNEKKFLGLLESRRVPLLYTGKEIVKRLVPLRTYEGLRRLLFKFSKPD
jgi:peptidoglycan/xylan/chitin deacetylase (PgdA/CDA1 family)